jgi:hypothetical protein
MGWLSPQLPRRSLSRYQPGAQVAAWQPKIGFEEGQMRTISYFEALQRWTPRKVRKLPPKMSA